MTEKQSDIKGLIYNIQRYSLHDGPGIRTIVFLKGCILHCPWCANPESKNGEVELMGTEIVGREVTVEEIINVVKRDMPFYKRSNGGMTLSGGEPLMQPIFSQQLVKEAKKEGINVAIETSGYQSWDLLWKVVEDIDTVLLDIKLMDTKKHKEIIGVNNDLILSNAEKMSKMNKKMIIRVPIIPGYNDDLSNLIETAKFAKSVGINEMHLLPYHRLGVHKYMKLNKEYELHDVKPLSNEKLRALAAKIRSQIELNITIY